MLSNFWRLIVILSLSTADAGISLAHPLAASPLAPTAPPLAPTAPLLAPTAPLLAPTAPPLAPTAPPLAPTAPPLAPTAPILLSIQTFQASGHLVGFTSTGWHLTNGTYTLRATFVNANATPNVSSTPTAAPINSARHAAAPFLTQAQYVNLWPGINLTYAADQAGIMRSTFTLAPGAQAAAIRWRYNAPVTLAADGNLRLDFATGTLYETAPIAWQDLPGQRQPVAVQFVLHDQNEIGLALGQHDPQYPVVIDPLLIWNTFIGSSSSDSAYVLAVDGGGNVYVGGMSNATWQGTVAPPQPYMGGGDGFVAKFNSNGTLLWNTFIGGAASDAVRGLDFDSTGSNLYVTGQSSGTWGAPIRGFSGGTDTFVTRLSTGDGVRSWNTFLGGAGTDAVYGKIDLDSLNYIYVTGVSDAVWGSPVLTHTTGNNMDAYVARIAPTGVLSWNTFLGSTGTDYAWSARTDNTYVYIAGWSTNTWGPAPIRAYSGGADGFLARLTANTGALNWNTFLGGDNTDAVYDLALSGGAIYAVGASSASWGDPVRPHQGFDDINVVRVTTAGALVWNTFLGGPSIDDAFGVSADATGNVYVTGSSSATWGVPARPFTAPGTEAYAARLTGATGAFGWNTFLGGTGSDAGWSIATGPGSMVYVAGNSSSTWGAPLRAFTGSSDVFVARLNAQSENFLPMTNRAYPIGLPISQTFESGVLPPANWTQVQTSGTTWVITNAYSHNGSYAAFVNLGTGQDEVLLSPPFTAGNAQLSFYALGSRSLCVVQNRCDLNVWLVVGEWGGGDDQWLYNAETDWVTDYQWVTTTVTIPANFQTVRVGLQYTSDPTNNGAGLAIDDINITP